ARALLGLAATALVGASRVRALMTLEHRPCAPGSSPLQMRGQPPSERLLPAVSVPPKSALQKAFERAPLPTSPKNDGQRSAPPRHSPSCAPVSNLPELCRPAVEAPR